MTQSYLLSIVIFIISFFVIHCQETKVDIRIQREHTQTNFPVVIGVCSMSTTTTTTTTTTTVTSTQTTTSTTTSTSSQTTTSTTTSTSTQTTTSTTSSTSTATSTTSTTTTTTTSTTTTTTTSTTTTTLPSYAGHGCGVAWSGDGGWLGDKILGRNDPYPQPGYGYYTDEIQRGNCHATCVFCGGDASGIRTPNFYGGRMVECAGDYKCTFLVGEQGLAEGRRGEDISNWCYKPDLAGTGNNGSYKIDWEFNDCSHNVDDGCMCWDTPHLSTSCHGVKFDWYGMYCELTEFTPTQRRRSTEQTCEELGGQEHYLETIITSGTLSMTLDDFYFLKTSYGFIGTDKKIITNYITAQTCMDKNCLFEPTSFTTTNAWFSLGPMTSFFLTNLTNLQTIFIPFNPQALSMFQETDTANVCLRIQTNHEINIQQIDSYIPNIVPVSEILNSGKFQFSYSFKYDNEVYDSLFLRQGLSLVIDVNIADLFLQIHPQAAYLNGYNSVTCS